MNGIVMTTSGIVVVTVMAGRSDMAAQLVAIVIYTPPKTELKSWRKVVARKDRVVCFESAQFPRSVLSGITTL